MFKVVINVFDKEKWLFSVIDPQNSAVPIDAQLSCRLNDKCFFLFFVYQKCFTTQVSIHQLTLTCQPANQELIHTIIHTHMKQPSGRADGRSRGLNFNRASRCCRAFCWLIFFHWSDFFLKLCVTICCVFWMQDTICWVCCSDSPTPNTFLFWSRLFIKLSAVWLPSVHSAAKYSFNNKKITCSVCVCVCECLCVWNPPWDLYLMLFKAAARLTQSQRVFVLICLIYFGFLLLRSSYSPATAMFVSSSLFSGGSALFLLSISWLQHLFACLFVLCWIQPVFIFTWQTTRVRLVCLVHLFPIKVYSKSSALKKHQY